MRRRQNGCHIADDICISSDWKCLNSNDIPLKRTACVSIHGKSALLQVMAWRRTSDKPSPSTNDVLIHIYLYAIPGLDE